MDLKTNREMVPSFSGQSTPIPPTHIPMLERLANPQREIAQIILTLGSRSPSLPARSAKAMNHHLHTCRRAFGKGVNGIRIISFVIHLNIRDGFDLICSVCG